MKEITKLLFTVVLSAVLVSCNMVTESPKPTSESVANNAEADKAEIATLLDSFNAAAARADFETYFLTIPKMPFL